MAHFRTHVYEDTIQGVIAPKGAFSTKKGYFRTFRPKRGIFDQKGVFSKFSPEKGHFAINGVFWQDRAYSHEIGYEQNFCPKKEHFCPKWEYLRNIPAKKELFRLNWSFRNFLPKYIIAVKFVKPIDSL